MKGECKQVTQEDQVVQLVILNVALLNVTMLRCYCVTGGLNVIQFYSMLLNVTILLNFTMLPKRIRQLDSLYSMKTRSNLIAVFTTSLFELQTNQFKRFGQSSRKSLLLYPLILKKTALKSAVVSILHQSVKPIASVRGFPLCCQYALCFWHAQCTRSVHCSV